MTSPPSGSPILAADDEPQLLRLIERVLQRASYEVVTAGDGVGALRQLELHGEALRVVLLDAAIAPRGADEIVEAAAKGAALRGVVLMSGDALDAPLRARLHEHDGVFLRKPFRPDALLRAVEDSLIVER